MSRLATLRFDAGLSRQALADGASVSYETVRNIEETDARPQAKTAKKLADFLTDKTGHEVKPSDLFPLAAVGDSTPEDSAA